MPIITDSRPFRPPLTHFGAHLQTILPALTRHFPEIIYRRERLELADGDFLDLDWLDQKEVGNCQKLVVLTHGLEGSTDRAYMKGMAKIFHENGWAVLAWNCRSCSGEPNRLFRMYHHGDIEDLTTVIDHAFSKKKWAAVALVGFSMGGSMTLKYVGTQGQNIRPEIRAAIGFSVPCDIAAGADALDRADNLIYKRRFLRALSAKIVEKDRHFPGKLDVSLLKKVRRWRDFDEWFSAPIGGFSSAAGFHENASSKNFVGGTRIPTLLVSAANDPILMPSCFPEDLARDHPFFFLEKTAVGGHVGFLERGQTAAWSERRAIEWVNEKI